MNNIAVAELAHECDLTAEFEGNGIVIRQRHYLDRHCAPMLIMCRPHRAKAALPKTRCQLRCPCDRELWLLISDTICVGLARCTRPNAIHLSALDASWQPFL